MNDLTLYSTADESKTKLTSRFIISGMIGVCLIVLGLGVGGYTRLQITTSDEMSRRVQAELQRRVASAEARIARIALSEESFSQDNPESELANKENVWDSRLLAELGRESLRLTDVKEAALYDRSRKLVWTSREGISLSEDQRIGFASIAQNTGIDYLSFGHNLLKFDTWKRVFKKDYRDTPMLASFRLQDGSIGVAKLLVDNRKELATARRIASRLMMVVAASTLLLFLLLYSNFRRGIRKINEQEEKLNHQIARLSNLLDVNKSMQKSMKTASARAVELNEQFLRRVGADLHDGPAQMIGFAVLRLDQVSKQEEAKQLGHEFHAVREALDESLEEIRGISSGLVLPELEQLSLEECLRKVITLHGTKSDAAVAQFYQDIPDNIPLPIKICSYRFVQEGLNNSEKHGQATKCRLTAQVKEDVLHLSLKDNGMGFRKSQLNIDGGHLGLMGLKDRIESLGGKFSINSELGVGTALKFSVSLADDG